MRSILTCLCLALLLGACGEAPSPDPIGNWSAWLDSPGGRLEFELSVSRSGEGYASEISGGEEILRMPTHFANGELVIEFPHFDSTIRANYDARNGRLEGEWRKFAGTEKWASLSFHALRRAHDGARMPAEGPSVEGRWAVDFESSEDAAVGTFEHVGDSEYPVRGSFLTTTGDYRYLWGTLDAQGALHLQAFDGAHAFLFKAQLQEDGSLLGDFWSRDSWHESWSAARDEELKLPDPFALTRLEESIPLASLRFPDLEGTLRALDDPAFAGKARIIEIFGTWCPNCYDATQYLKELNARYADQGLSILGLAFELSGDPVRDSAQVRRYVATEEIPYPILLAGTYNKDEASKAFPLIDRVRSYPTFLFVNSEGVVTAIYTGFSGPATGAAHLALQRGFEQLIEELLD